MIVSLRRQQEESIRVHKSYDDVVSGDLRLNLTIVTFTFDYCCFK